MGQYWIGADNPRTLFEHIRCLRVIVEVPRCLNLQGVPIKSRSKRDLANERPRCVCPRRMDGGRVWVEPFRHTAVVAKPGRVSREVVALKAPDACDDLDPILRGGAPAEEVVLCERADESITTKQQRQGFHDGRLAAVVGPDKHRVPSERDLLVSYV